ncbi:MAG: PHP domain-containing protein [Prevotellaceae bacterium]|nr:PHP domain-containing protein [Candidatus Faecinaster equi]
MEEIKEKYQLTADYHTHTVYSVVGPYKHAKGTIMENVAAAHEQGLTELAITDHGPKEFYGLDSRKLGQMRAEIKEAQEKYPDVKVLLGVEANIMDSPNGLDVEPEHIADYDFINAGYHYGVPRCHMISNWISFHLPCPQSFKDRVSRKNTELALRALKNNTIKILTHPGDKAYFDMSALAKACEETGTLVEINARHKRPNVEDIKQMAKYAVDFIISSDAHRPEHVGRYVKTVALALEAGVIERVVNIKER